MRATRIVTSFVMRDGKILILRRSGKVRSMKGLWAGVSGIIEGDEEPLERARTEIREELGMTQETITLLRAGKTMVIGSPEYGSRRWEVFPFLFGTRSAEVRLNWENSEYRWIEPGGLGGFDTVPGLDRVLACLL